MEVERKTGFGKGQKEEEENSQSVYYWEILRSKGGKTKFQKLCG